MRTIVLGDTHGRAFWKLVAYNEFDRLIFIGDYFDSFDINTEAQIHNFLDIIEYKKTIGKEVVMLIGNHDHHYFPEVGDGGTSGYQKIGKLLIEPVIAANREHLQMAYEMPVGDDMMLFTHAGVGESWLEKNTHHEMEGPLDNVAARVNDVWKYKPLAFSFTGRNPYGDDMGQTPIWIRPLSLTKDSHKLRKKYIQVVGHTGQKKLLTDNKSTLGGRYYFIDTIGSSKEYMNIEDGVITARKIYKTYDKSKTEEEL